MSTSLTAILATLKALLPALEPVAQAQIDALLVGAEAQIAAAAGTSPDFKIIEQALVAAVKVIVDAEGQRLLPKA